MCWLPTARMDARNSPDSTRQSDCAALSRGIGRPELATNFQAIREQFPSPEEINDSPVTAPSKRVGQLVPGYEKPIYGTLGVLEIGLEAIRKACPHFREWLICLEGGI
ncbi:MAG: DUF4276 family protein [Nitrospinae bacterium]|nr:DUF4276 family protein [Nitrospinota bacterium]